MKIKARVFLGGKQIEPSQVEQLIIKNSTVDRIVNDVAERIAAKDFEGDAKSA